MQPFKNRFRLAVCEVLKDMVSPLGKLVEFRLYLVHTYTARPLNAEVIQWVYVLKPCSCQLTQCCNHAEKLKTIN